MVEDISKDWKYYSKEVEVYRLVTQVGEFYLSYRQGEEVKKILASKKDKDRMIFVDESNGIRMFLIQAIFKEKKKFYELSGSVKKRLLQEGVFTQEELSEFSDKVRTTLPEFNRVERLNG